jgi:hypothetical protein
MEEDNSTSFGMVFFGGGTLLAVGVVVAVLLLLVAVPDIPCFLLSIVVAVAELGWAELYGCSDCGGGGYIYMSLSWMGQTGVGDATLACVIFAVAMEIEIHPRISLAEKIHTV